MPSRWQIESLKSRLDSLAREINRVSEKDHPYRDPDTVYEALKLVIASRSAILEDAVAEYTSDNKRSERLLQGTFFAVAESADDIAELFAYAERVDSARIPFEILRSLSWVASSLVKQECHVVVRLDQEYNYTIISCRRDFEEKGWKEEWEQAVAKTRARRKSFPSDDMTWERAIATANLTETGNHIAIAQSLRSLTEAAEHFIGDFKQLSAGTIFTSEATALNQIEETASRVVEISKKLVPPPEEKPYTILLLGFPSYDASSILLHALAAHELGHEICFQQIDKVFGILAKAVKRAVEPDNTLNTEIQDVAAKRTMLRKTSTADRKEAFPENVNQIQARLLEFLNYWIVEIFSDLYAANLLGPSFIAAFDKIELRPYRIDRKHPSGDFRRGIIQDFLNKYLPHVMEEDAWKPLFENEIPRQSRGADDDPLSPLYEVGERICRLCFDDLAALVASHRSPLSDTDNLASVLARTNRHLMNLAPPSVPMLVTGTDEDVDLFWLLIYSAWRFRFDKDSFDEFTKVYAKKDKARADEILGNLLLDALESLEIRFLYQRDALERMGKL